MTRAQVTKACINKDSVWYTDNDGEDFEVRVSSVINNSNDAIIAFSGSSESYNKYMRVSLDELKIAGGNY